MSYTAPLITDLGSLTDLTLGKGNPMPPVNKIGFTNDKFSASTGVIGSIVPPRSS